MLGTNTGFPQDSGKNLFAGIRTQRYQKRNNQSQKNHQTVGKSANDFLTAVFEPLWIADYNTIYSKNNYNYLYDSAFNYASLLGIEFKSPSKYPDFKKLYTDFKAVLPAEQCCELVQEGDDLFFQIYEDKEEGKLYFVPCHIIDQADGDLKEIYISFFSIFQKTQGLVCLSEIPLYEMLCSDLPDNGQIDKEDEWMMILNEYENGEIGNTLKLIDNEPKFTIRQLINRIKKYKPQSEKEEKILSLIMEGLTLFKLNKKIMDFSFFPHEDEDYYDCYYPVDLNRFILIVYEKDLMFENLFSWTCDEANESGYEILSSGFDFISPKTEILIKTDDYVSRFLNWINRLCDELYD